MKLEFLIFVKSDIPVAKLKPAFIKLPTPKEELLAAPVSEVPWAAAPAVTSCLPLAVLV